MAVVVSYHPTRADIYRSAYVGLRAQPLIWAFVIGVFLVLPWGAAALGIVAHFAWGMRLGPDFLALCLVPFLFVAASLVLIPLRVRGVRTMQGTHTYEFSDSGIMVKGPGIESRLEWPSLTRCHAARQGLLFLSGNFPFISVPGRALTPSSRTELLALAESKGVKLSGRRS